MTNVEMLIRTSPGTITVRQPGRAVSNPPGSAPARVPRGSRRRRCLLPTWRDEPRAVVRQAAVSARWRKPCGRVPARTRTGAVHSPGASAVTWFLPSPGGTQSGGRLRLGTAQFIPARHYSSLKSHAGQPIGGILPASEIVAGLVLQQRLLTSGSAYVVRFAVGILAVASPV